MASNDRSRRKCYTFIWKLENVRYCWHQKDTGIESPAFVVDEIKESRWRLIFFPRLGEDGRIAGLSLLRLADKPAVNVEIDSDIAFLAFNGTVLFSGSCRNITFGHESTRFLCNAKREDVFPEKRSSFNFRDTFTVQFKIWKSEGEISKDVQCIARTRISVQKTSFLWQIENFSSLESEKRSSYDIKSLKDNRMLMCVSLSIKRDKKIDIAVFPKDQEIKFFIFDLSVIDGAGNSIKDLSDGVWSNEPDKTEKKSLSLSKTKLTEKKNIYIPNDVLSLKCKCVISFGIKWNEIEGIIYDCTAFEKDEMLIVSDEENVLSVSKDVLNESFKSLLSEENESKLFKHMMNNLQKFVENGSLSDIKLSKNSKTLYFANKFILSARSPVFKNMFSGEMNDDKVDIDDMEEDTLSRILQYIYRSEVEQLDWISAIKLYVGADKYKILDLKVKCSDYLMKNLSPTNAVQALRLADQHQDLKRSVQNFILRKSASIMNSDEWLKLMNDNPMLASETMHLAFIKSPKKSGEKEERPSGCQEKRNREDERKDSYPISKYFKKSDIKQDNAVPSCSSTPQLPLEVLKEPANQKELEDDLIQESPSMEFVETSNP